MNTPFDAAFKTPVGWIGLRVEHQHLRELVLLSASPDIRRPVDISSQRLIEHLQTLLYEYLESGHWPQNLPLEPQGTDFQKRVWHGLLGIPQGQRKTYGDLAKQLNTSARAIGGACRANPIPLLIPCHRVVAARGDGGFAGHTSGHWMELKRWLLKRETDG